jgi:hypothetical protein
MGAACHRRDRGRAEMERRSTSFSILKHPRLRPIANLVTHNRKLASSAQGQFSPRNFVQQRSTAW